MHIASKVNSFTVVSSAPSAVLGAALQQNVCAQLAKLRLEAFASVQSALTLARD